MRKRKGSSNWSFGTREIQITNSGDGDFEVTSSSFLYRIWDRLYRVTFKRMSKILRIFLWYLTFSLVGGALLYWPATHNPGAEAISYIDALFMASSAFSDTGLTTVTIVEQFNIWGQLILFFEILIGGIGWFTFKIFLLSFIIRKGMTWKNKAYLAQESGADMKTAVGIAKTAGIVTVGAILIFGPILGAMFHQMPPIEGMVDPTTYNPTEDWGQAMWTGYFMAGSAINNAGMDVIGGNSLYAYYDNYAIQFTIMSLFVLGGMGFGIIYDVYQYFINRWKGQRFRFSLLTKVSVITYLVVAFIGLGLAYTFEVVAYFNNTESSFLGMDATNNPYVLDSTGQVPVGDLGSMTDRLVAIAFNTMSTRNAGFSTVDLNAFSEATQVTYDVMMFIGSGPGSTAGGIRTTTLFVIVLVVSQYITGKKEATAFNRQFPKETITKAFVLTISALALVFISSLLITVLETGNVAHTEWIYTPDYNGVTPVEDWMMIQTDVEFTDALFVTFSAFGTTGLSTIDIASLTTGSKSILIIVMFIGQLGILAALKVFSRKDSISESKQKPRMLEESIPIG